MRISSGSPCCTIDSRSTIAPTQRTEARPKRCRSPGSNRIAGAKGPSRTQRLDRAPSPYGVGRTEPADPEHRERSILARGTRQRIGRRVAELAARENRTARSIRMTLSLAFLDPALIDAACTGTLPRGDGVTRLMDLPARFADQWRALGLTRPV